MFSPITCIYQYTSLFYVLLCLNLTCINILFFRDDDSLFNEAGQEIQTILFQSYNSAYQKSLDLSASTDFLAKEVEETLEIHFPIFSASPCSSSTPITPPTRSHNPMAQDSSFTSDNDRVPEGAELGLLSVSPPPTAKLF